MTSTVDLSTLCHRARRAFLKKEKRRRLRQAIARSRDEAIENDEISRRLSPSYSEYIQLEKKKLHEEEEQRAQDEAAWLDRERRAQEAWQAKLANLRCEEQPITAAPQTLSQLPSSNEGSEDLPVEIPTTSVVYLTTRVLVSNPVRPSKEVCSFFRKTGACRFGVRCSRVHNYPSRSDSPISDGLDLVDPQEQHSLLVLRIADMFEHRCLQPQSSTDQHDDSACDLENDDSQLLADYMDFYHDVHDELEARWGRIAALRTCRNKSVHLRGAVYVEFSRGSNAAWDAAENCQGRWYAGKQLSCAVVRLGGGWREAVCGLYHRGRCPKGDDRCNFLHVFLNPGETVHDFNCALQQHLGQLPSGLQKMKPGRHSFVPKRHRTEQSASVKHDSPRRCISSRDAHRTHRSTSSNDSSPDRISRRVKCTDSSKNNDRSPLDRHVSRSHHGRSRHLEHREQRSRHRHDRRKHESCPRQVSVSHAGQTTERSRKHQASRHVRSDSVTSKKYASSGLSSQTAVRSQHSPRPVKLT